MSKSLRKLIRYSLRARRLLFTEGPRGLFRAAERRFKGPSLLVRPEHRVLKLAEPFLPLRFPACPLPPVSVVVPIQGDLESTHHCLAALEAQETVHAFEVIVVDGCSMHDGANRCPRWENVRVIANGQPSGFSASCNRGAAIARGEYLVFLNEHTQVQAGWLDALIDTFDLRADAGIVGSRLLYPDGRQQEAGGIVFADGGICRYGCLDDPYRPEYSYLRAVDFCSAKSVAVRRSLFFELQGFDADLASASYTHIDFAFRMAQAGFSVYYQPLSEVVDCETEGVGMEKNGCGMTRLDEIDHDRFVRRWKAVLLGHGFRTDPLELEKERSISRRAFVSDFAIPAPDRDSGSLRMVNLFAILQEQGFKVTFASMGLEARQPYLSHLQKRGIECLYGPYEDSIEEHLRRQGAYYDLVILSRVDTAAELLPVARRWCRRAKIVFDTVDLHFLRVAREADLRNDPRIKRIANRKKKQELELIAKADTTLVVSEAEAALLAAQAPGADVRIISNIHHIYGSAEPFEERRDILFIGGFAHPPNTDAVLFFCRDVLPRVLAAVPGVRFLVVGSGPPPEVAGLASVDVRILGYVPDVEPYLRSCRLSVAPLRFGAGVKGKINQSLAHGLPVVASSVAVEGMFLQDGASVLIADDGQAFADAVVRLYQDEVLWSRLSVGGLAVMDEHFSFAAARKAVADLLAS